MEQVFNFVSKEPSTLSTTATASSMANSIIVVTISPVKICEKFTFYYDQIISVNSVTVLANGQHESIRPI
ncbi:hypothetical protein BLOT_012360 [Blomia tropicalis]|nr:hypothetical protein BLOT_012360 [Blomia tropicalis]